MNVDPVSAGATAGIFLVSLVNSLGVLRIHRQVKSPNGETTGEAVRSTKKSTDSLKTTTAGIRAELHDARAEARKAASLAQDAAREAKAAAELARASNSIAADAAARLGEFLREWDKVDPN